MNFSYTYSNTIKSIIIHIPVYTILDNLFYFHYLYTYSYTNNIIIVRILVKIILYEWLIYLITIYGKWNSITLFLKEINCKI